MGGVGQSSPPGDNGSGDGHVGLGVWLGELLPSPQPLLHVGRLT